MPPVPPDTQPLWIPVSLGELVDRITILELKQRHLAGSRERTAMARELALLTDVLQRCGRTPADPVFNPLREINAALWALEERIRAQDRDGAPGAEYSATARQIHRLNDRRHRIRREISLAGGSLLVEEKSHEGEV